MINFTKKEGKVRLQIDLEAARKARLQLSSKLFRGHFGATPELAGIPAVWVEVGGDAALARGHSAQRVDEAGFRRREVGEQVAYGPTLVGALP